MKTKTWLRLYHEFADDPKIQMLAFEDQRHYVMVLCLKGRGVLDSNTPTTEYRERMIAKALGLDPLSSREVKFRLMEPGLIDENWQPVRWAERQFESDSSTERVQKHREKRKRFGNVSSKQEPEPDGQLVDRSGNVSVTAQIRSEQSKNSPPGNSYEAKSADARATPSGSRAAPQEPDEKSAKGRGKPPPDAPSFDPQLSRQTWFSFVHNAIVSGAVADGIAARGVTGITELPLYPRTTLAPVLAELTDWAIAEERNAFPNFTVRIRKGIEDEIDARIRRELKPLRPKTPAELQAAPQESA